MKNILLFFAVLTTCFVHSQQIFSEPTVLVQGEGMVKVVPDGVIIKSRIEHDGADPQEVKRKNDEAVNDIIKYLKSEGIPAKNIQTDYINLNKNYNYDSKTYSYVANQAISIKLENLSRYEEIISGLLEAGLNRIDGIEFSSSKLEHYKSEARKKAVVNARQKAEEYAGALGQTIGKAITISELEINNYQPVYRMNEMMRADSAEAETIAPGELEIRTKVSVGFELD